MIIQYNEAPRFLVAVDCVIFTFDDDALHVLLHPRGLFPFKGKWSLLGGFIKENESGEDAAKRVIKMTVGLEDIFLEQVGSFSEPHRDTGGRVISLAYYSLIRVDDYRRDLVREHGGHWWPVNKLPELIFDHQQMIDLALLRLQRKANVQLLGSEILPELFTLTQLNTLYNAIFQRNFDAGNFRKKIKSLKALEKTSVKDKQNSRRGAYYYRFKDNMSDIFPDRIVKP